MSIKRIYFASSYKFRDEVIEIYSNLKEFLKLKYSIELYSFVFEYKGSIEDHEMMKQDFFEMDNSDIIIADVSHKSIGVGVEVGYFKAQNKKIIYLHEKNAEVENVINGVSDYVINYSNYKDIHNWFEDNIVLLSN